MNKRPSLLEIITKYSIITSYAFGLIFLFIDIFIGCTSLIVASSSTNPRVKYYLYTLLAISGIVLILYAVLTALYFVGDDEERSTKGRIIACQNIRFTTRIFNVCYGLVLLLIYFIEKGLGAGNPGWDSFLLTMSYVYLAIFIILFFYSLWKRAWIKENPERFTYAEVNKGPEGNPQNEQQRTFVNHEHVESNPNIDTKETVEYIDAESVVINEREPNVVDAEVVEVETEPEEVKPKKRLLGHKKSKKK